MVEESAAEYKKRKAGKRLLGRRFINNRWIVKNIPFYLFVAAITIIYIANGHYADKTIRNINSTAKHLKEMEYEFKTVKQEVIFRSKESELAKAVEPLGLTILNTSPVRLVDTLQEK